jgi:L-threonylcarbamoyladenylate synthase
LDQKEQYRRAVDVLREGGVAAMPTDTVYGLIAVAADDGAVRRVFEIKGRPDDQPLPLFVGSIEQAELIGEFTDSGRRLGERFWPGPLTIVVPKKAGYRTLASAGDDTIGIRVPDDPALREIAAQLGPVTATSANRSGEPECRSAAAVRAQLADAADVIVDAPLRPDARASTVVDCTEPRGVRVLREGAIERATIAEALVGVSALI